VPEVLDDLVQLPLGAHGLSLYATQEEAADHAVSFLAGNPPGKAAAYWIADPALLPSYDAKLATRAPGRIGCIHVLPKEQVERVGGRLRPVEEILLFVRNHPEGVSGGADTISLFWVAENIPDHLEYEAWLERQPRGESRFLCPYDLRRVPLGGAPAVLRELGKRHSHAALSASDEPAVRLLQLFVFGVPEQVPPELRNSLGWARGLGLIRPGGPEEGMSLTPAGENVVEEWSRNVTFNW
jgi:hypothetical protein